MAAALTDADIICTTTSATEPFLAAAMVPAGAHLNAVGGSAPYMRELLPDCVPALSFFTDYRPSLEAQAGEVIDARALGHLSADWQATEIGEVIAGTRPGRTSDAQRTVYRSLGVASQDLAAADFIVARAVESQVRHRRCLALTSPLLSCPACTPASGWKTAKGILLAIASFARLPISPVCSSLYRRPSLRRATSNGLLRKLGDLSFHLTDIGSAARANKGGLEMSYLLSRRALLAGSASGAALLAFPRATWSAEPAKGGRLVVAADSEPPNLNPAMVASNGVFFVASKVIEPLAESSYEGKDGLSPRLATAWEGSADGKSVTLKLREGVTWHDGKPFTSADVAFSALKVWKELQNLGRVVFKQLTAVDTPDEHTAILQFATPTPSSSFATRCRR